MHEVSRCPSVDDYVRACVSEYVGQKTIQCFNTQQTHWTDCFIWATAETNRIVVLLRRNGFRDVAVSKNRCPFPQRPTSYNPLNDRHCIGVAGVAVCMG